MRRSHIKLNTKNLIEDKDSGEIRLSHHVDMTTGMYNGKKIFTPKAEK
jgi:large subunit ribosomal protein L32